MHLALIVEGHGEVEALPVLLRKIFVEINPSKVPVMSRNTTLRVPKGSILKEGGVEKAIRTAIIRSPSIAAVLVLIDSDGGCPAQLGPQLLARLQACCNHLHTSAVIAHREYETWFIHAISSFSTHKDFVNGIAFPSDPESIQDAKKWIARQKNDGTYSEVLDQPRYSSIIDLNLARNSDSFDKLYREAIKISDAI